MSSVKVVFRKDKVNKNGEGPVCIFVYENGVTKKYSTGIRVRLEDWDFKNNEVKSKHKNSARTNALIASKKSEYWDEYCELKTLNKSVHNIDIQKNKPVNQETELDFLSYSLNAIKDHLKNDSVGTYDKDKSVITKITNYVGKEQLLFKDITPEFLEKYETHFRTREVRPNKTNTIVKDMKFIKKIFNRAIKEKKISSDLNPFTIYSVKPQKTSRVFLTKEEVSKIENLKITPGTKKDIHRDMFVFACYTGGIRVSDVLKLKWKDYDGTKIYFTMKKTGEPIGIKVSESIKGLLNKYRKENSKPNDFIFPIFPNNLDISDARTLDTAISRASAYINKNLKEIEEEIELGKHISFHTSRHTFATLALSLGVPLHLVSKLIGHSDIKETQVYAKILGKDLEESMDFFNAKI